MRLSFFILTLILVAGCSSKPRTTASNIVVVPVGKPNLPGCLAPPAKRPFREISGNFWQAVREIDALLAPEPDPVTGIAPSPEYLEGWMLLEPLLNDCEWCNTSDWVQLYQRAAIAHYFMENKKVAIHYFKKVLELSPMLPESVETQILYEIAKMLVEQNNYSEALAYFERWESMCPSSVPAEYPELRRKAEVLE